MTVPTIQTIRETRTLTIFQKIMENDQTSVNDFIDSNEDSVWLTRQVELEGEAELARLCESTRGLLFGVLLRVLTDSREAEETLEKLYAEFRQELVQLDSEHEKRFIWLIGIAPAQNLEQFPLNRQFNVIEIINRNVIAA